MRWDVFVEDVAKEVSLPAEIVERSYRSMFSHFRRCIIGLDFDDGITEEQFRGMSTSFSIPSIGKIYCDYDLMKKVLYYKDKARKAKGEKKHEDKEDKADVFIGSSDEEQVRQ